MRGEQTQFEKKSKWLILLLQGETGNGALLIKTYKGLSICHSGDVLTIFQDRWLDLRCERSFHAPSLFVSRHANKAGRKNYACMTGMHSKGTLDLDITTDNSRFASCGKWRGRERNTRVKVIVIPSVGVFWVAVLTKLHRQWPNSVCVGCDQWQHHPQILGTRKARQRRQVRVQKYFASESAKFTIIINLPIDCTA